MNPALLSLLAEAETAQIRLEKSRHAEEAAKTAVEAAKAALEAVKAETAGALTARDEVLSKAEATGLQRKAFRTLVEDRVTALQNSGLFNMAEALPVTVPASKPRTVKRREAEPAVVPAAESEAMAPEDEGRGASLPLAPQPVASAPIPDAAPPPASLQETEPTDHEEEYGEEEVGEAAEDAEAEHEVPPAGPSAAPAVEVQEPPKPQPPSGPRPSFLKARG